MTENKKTNHEKEPRNTRLHQKAIKNFKNQKERIVMTDEIKQLEHIFNVHYKICFALIVTCGITVIILAVVSMIIGRILEVFIVIGGVLFIACLVSHALMSSAKTKLFNEIYRHLDET